MFEKIIKTVITFFKREFRAMLLIAVSLAILIPAGLEGAITYPAALMLGIASLAHALRRVLFPYVNMKTIANKADETPLSSAIVYASNTLFIAVLFFCAVWMVK